jgi:hypothetical protein
MQYEHQSPCIINELITLLFAVSRLHCESESFKMDMILDVNTWVYPMELGKEGLRMDYLHFNCS